MFHFPALRKNKSEEKREVWKERESGREVGGQGGRKEGREVGGEGGGEGARVQYVRVERAETGKKKKEACQAFRLDVGGFLIAINHQPN